MNSAEVMLNVGARPQRPGERGGGLYLLGLQLRWPLLAPQSLEPLLAIEPHAFPATGSPAGNGNLLIKLLLRMVMTLLSCVPWARI